MREAREAPWATGTLGLSGRGCDWAVATRPLPWQILASREKAPRSPAPWLAGPCQQVKEQVRPRWPA